MSETTQGRRGPRYLWIGPLVGFLLYATGLMADEILDPITSWLRRQSTASASTLVVLVAALVIWSLVRRERNRRRRIETIRDRIRS